VPEADPRWQDAYARFHTVLGEVAAVP